MKRYIIALGITAIAAFIIYQFTFADHRTRLFVERSNGNDHEVVEETHFAPDPELNALDVLSQEAFMNESMNTPHDEEAIERLGSVLKGVDRQKIRSRIITRKLIKNVFLDFQVNNIDSARKAIEGFVTEANGYTASENQNTYSGGPQFQQLVRVPSDKLSSFVSNVTSIAKKMKSRSMSTKDVTDEFIDLEARLITKKELETNYRSILKQAKTVKDMLEVEEELEEVRGEIESMEGRLQYLRNQVEFNTVSITYFQLVPVMIDDESFGQRLVSSLSFGWDNVLEFIIDLFTAWPAIIILGIGLPLIYRWFRRWKTHPRQVGV